MGSITIICELVSETIVLLSPRYIVIQDNSTQNVYNTTTTVDEIAIERHSLYQT